MRKKLVSLVLVAALFFTIPLSAFATARFNKSVFYNYDGLFTAYDDMEGIFFVRQSDTVQMSLWTDATSMVTLEPEVFIADNLDAFLFQFSYLTLSPAEFDSIIFKIGDNRYNFSNCYVSSSMSDDGIYSESISFYVKKEIIPFMQDFIKHNEEEIKVRIRGTYKTLDFVLSDAMKTGLTDLYLLYVAGGGTNDLNMSTISSSDPVIIARNGIVLY